MPRPPGGREPLCRRDMLLFTCCCRAEAGGPPDLVTQPGSPGFCQGQGTPRSGLGLPVHSLPLLGTAGQGSQGREGGRPQAKLHQKEPREGAASLEGGVLPGRWEHGLQVSAPQGSLAWPLVGTQGHCVQHDPSPQYEKTQEAIWIVFTP